MDLPARSEEVSSNRLKFMSWHIFAAVDICYRNDVDDNAHDHLKIKRAAVLGPGVTVVVSC